MRDIPQGTASAVSRLGVIVLYDKDGVIDRYVFFLLASLNTVTDRIVIAVNGKIQEKYAVALRGKGYTVYVRENKGGDFGAYKDVLENMLGWEEVSRYDELVLSNDTYYGPLYPFAQVFSRMEKRPELDFWTITKTEGDYESQSGGIPRSAQGYFTVIRSVMLHSHQFREFWQLPLFNGSSQHKDWVAIEHAWLDYFEPKFVWDAYVGSPVFSAASKQGQFPVYLFANGRMITNCGCPVLKRRTFNYGSRTLQYSGHGDLRSALDYIESYTDYDVDMIWENVLRVYNIADIREAVPLADVCEAGSKLPTDSSALASLIIVVALPPGGYALPYFQEYVGHLSADIILLVCNPADQDTALQICQQCAKGSCQVLSTGGQETLMYLLCHAEILEQYANVCFIDLYANEMPKQSVLVGESYRHDIWQSLAADDGYLQQLLALLARQPHLGMLVPPEPYHGNFFADLGDTWDGYYQLTRQLADALNMTCDISSARQTFGYTGSFLCRREALQKLCSSSQVLSAWWHKAEPQRRLGALRRLLVYVVQASGYYTATIQTNKQAGRDSSDLRFMLQEMVACIRHDSGAGNFVSTMLALGKRQLLSFAGRFQHLYIYGAGDYGQATCKMLLEKGVVPEAFVVSDGQPLCKVDLPVKVIFLSEAVRGKQTGLIIAVIKHRQGELIRTAVQRGFDNIFTI